MNKTFLPSQAARTVMMVRPARFEANAETSATNTFQQGTGGISPSEASSRALSEFDNLVSTLEEAGVRVIAFEDTPYPHTPDAVFPNNWISFHEDGTVVLYPMQAANRRAERRQDITASLISDHGFAIRNTVDLTPFEETNRYLEGTGSLVLDRPNRIAYAGISPRTHPEVVHAFAGALGYEPVLFHTHGESRAAVYHTNVLMCIGEGMALVCSAIIEDPAERKQVLDHLESTDHELIHLSETQMGEFAGNALELETGAGQRLFVMSSRAERSLSGEQKATIEKHSAIISSSVDTIETLGGGSVRCMLAAVHLPSQA